MDADDPQRETWLGVAGVAAGIAIIALAFALPFLLPTRALDAREALAERFEVGALPFGLEPRDALDLPLGERVVTLATAGANAEDAKREASEAQSEAESVADSSDTRTDDSASAGAAGSDGAGASGGGDGASGDGAAKPGGMPFFDWSKLPEGERDRPPSQVAIVWYPLASAEAIMREQFWNTSGGMGADFVGPMGGKVVLDGGEVAWGEFAAPFVRERRYVAEGAPGAERRSFRETLRVNLSRDATPCVLYATWPENLPASRARLAELLAALPPRRGG